MKRFQIVDLQPLQLICTPCFSLKGNLIYLRDLQNSERNYQKHHSCQSVIQTTMYRLTAIHRTSQLCSFWCFSCRSSSSRFSPSITLPLSAPSLVVARFISFHCPGGVSARALRRSDYSQLWIAIQYQGCQYKATRWIWIWSFWAVAWAVKLSHLAVRLYGSDCRRQRGRPCGEQYLYPSVISYESSLGSPLKYAACSLPSHLQIIFIVNLADPSLPVPAVRLCLSSKLVPLLPLIGEDRPVNLRIFGMQMWHQPLFRYLCPFVAAR